MLSVRFHAIVETALQDYSGDEKRNSSIIIFRIEGRVWAMIPLH